MVALAGIGNGIAQSW